MKTAIIIGVSGQDGTLLKKYLKNKNYTIVGIGNVKKEAQNLNKIKPWNILNKQSMKKLFSKVKNSEVYYLAAHHHSSEQNLNKVDFYELMQQSFKVHVEGLINVLNAIYEEKSNSRVFYASSSLIFSGRYGEIQNELTPIEPQGAYGISKAAGGMVAKEFREKLGLYVSTGILYNHESGLRNSSFLTRRIIETAIRISQGSKENCEVGDLEAVVDWGLASDYVQIFHKILQLENPEDFIIASGKVFKVKSFIKEVFNFFNLDWKDHVIETRSKLFRKSNPKCGSIKKLKKFIKKVPKYSISEFVYFLIKDVKNKTVI
jgi:GDPmannose 4,6-dehydratase